LATSQIEEGICWFARTVWDNLLYSTYLSISGSLPLVVSGYPCSHTERVGIKLLSELVIRDRFQRERLGTHSQGYFDCGNGVPGMW